MKTLNKAKMTTGVLVMVLTILFSACGNSSSESSAETTVKPPSMDISAAVFMGDLNTVVKHIQAGTDLNKKDQYGSTPLLIASTFGKNEIASALIDAGADLNITNAEGSTALYVASFFCHEEIVVALLKANADKEVRNSFGFTALESVNGPFETVKPIYMQIEKDMGVVGVKFDYDHLEKTRPVIAELLQ